MRNYRVSDEMITQYIVVILWQKTQNPEKALKFSKKITDQYTKTKFIRESLNFLRICIVYYIATVKSGLRKNTVLVIIKPRKANDKE